MSIKHILILAMWVATASCALQAKQLAVIADKGNSVSNVSAAELVKIFNGRHHNWPDGKAITIVMRDPSSGDMQLVLQKVLNMTAAQARNFAQAHHETVVVADSDDAVIHFVSSTRGAVGVIDLYSLTKDVNVLKIDGKLPVEQGYLLRGN